MKSEDCSKHPGRIIKQQRVASRLTARKLSAMSGVSTSHLGRIERGERFPSGRILQRIAMPLGFGEEELFTLAGFLIHQSDNANGSDASHYSEKRLDPYVARVLAQNPVETQRAVLAIATALKYIAKGIVQDNSGSGISETAEATIGMESLK